MIAWAAGRSTGSGWESAIGLLAPLADALHVGHRFAGPLGQDVVGDVRLLQQVGCPAPRRPLP